MSLRIIIASVLFVLISAAAWAQSGELLKGVIQQENFLSPSSEQFGGTAPGLTRKDISGKNTTVDPFDNNGPSEAAVSLPASATQTALVAPPMSPPATSYPYRPGTAESGIPENSNRQPAGYPTGHGNLQASVSANNDPDSSPELQLAWDAWHKRVAAAIFQRFDFFAHSAFKYSPPLMARVSYTVTRDGHIQNLNVVQHSTNPMFDLLTMQCVKSLDGDHNLLQFPPGSRRASVDKFGSFTQNYGIEGFKYTTGDRETIRR